MRRGTSLADNEKELLVEIAHLREDLKQLREIVNVLVNVVMEEDLEDEDAEGFSPYPSSENKFNIYN